MVLYQGRVTYPPHPHTHTQGRNLLPAFSHSKLQKKAILHIPFSLPQLGRLLTGDIQTNVYGQTLLLPLRGQKSLPFKP